MGRDLKKGRKRYLLLRFLHLEQFMNSQSVKTIRLDGKGHGVDEGEKSIGVNYRYHGIAFCYGVVHAANVHNSIDTADVIALLRGRFQRLIKIAANGGYRGEWIKKQKAPFRNRVMFQFLFL
ncbi:MAG: hypothetical protein GYA22_03405 [Bacteroidales bacterium]|nr:hypothetical protein [Bacteroidales bacterium]